MIQLENLKKSYGKQPALDEIKVNIPAGKITYIVGPNGSGKTTLLKLILGLVKQDEGRIKIGDFYLNGESTYREKIGYMPQQASFPENLTVSEIIQMVIDLRRNPSQTDEFLIKNFGLSKEMNKRLKSLSGGTKQKVNAAITFLFDPEILIMDEPTAGLDPASSSILKDKIQHERNKGKTILLTSHILGELEELAEQIIFLLEGKVRFAGTIEKLLETTERQNIERALADLTNGEV